MRASYTADAGKGLRLSEMCSDEEGKVLEGIEIPTDNEIYAQIAFEEQFFCGVLVK